MWLLEGSLVTLKLVAEKGGTNRLKLKKMWLCFPYSHSWQKERWKKAKAKSGNEGNVKMTENFPTIPNIIRKENILHN